MNLIRLLVLSLVVHGLTTRVLAAEPRYDVGDGHLAVKTNQDSRWRILRAADAIPSPSLLRTSPVGTTRIALPDGVLFLSADCEAEFDAAARKIAVNRGTARLLISDEPSAQDWQLASGQHAAICSRGAEFVMTAGRERPTANVLAGQVQLQKDGQAVGTFAVPKAEVASDNDRTAIAAEKMEERARRIRSTTELHRSQGLGQLVTKDAQSGSDVRLEIARYHVNVVLQPPVALVQIDQSFFNPFPTQQEGTFVFNLPKGASVSRFAMYVTHTQLIEGELIERKRADEIYTTIVRSRRDPAILEQIGDATFRMRVFPVPGRDTKRILLDFTMPLIADHGEYQFALPLMSDLKPIRDFRLTGTIHPPFAAQSIRSPTHPEIPFLANPDQTISFESHAANVKPPPHFTVRYSAPENRQPTVRTYQAKGDPDPYYVMTVPGSLNPRPPASEKPLRLLILVDTAGPAKSLAFARQAARSAVAGLHPEDRFRIGCVDASYRPLTDQWCQVGTIEADVAWRQLNDQFRLGAANLDATLPQALAEFKDAPEDDRKVVIYIGDGPSNEDDIRPTDTSPANASEIEHDFFAVTTADDSFASEWLSREVARKQGRLFGAMDMADPIGALFEWSLGGLSSPTRLKSVAIAGTQARDLFHDSDWPEGRELQLYGRGSLKDAQVVSITVDDQLIRFTTEPIGVLRDAADSENRGDSLDSDVFTGRLWARKKLQSLLREPSASSKEGQQDIVRFCQEWSLMSPLTAFLVLETEQDYTRWNVDRKTRRRYWKPAGAVDVDPLILKLPQPQSLQVDVPNREYVVRVLDLAERVLKRDLAEQAVQLLSTVRRDALRVDTERYQDLNRRANAKLRPQVALRQLMHWRPLADRTVSELLPSRAPLLLEFAHGGISTEFLDHFPHARELLRTVKDCPAELTLEEFAKFVQQQTGLPVIFDHVNILDEGIPLETRLDLDGLEGITVRSLLKAPLEPHGLTCIPEPHFLRITTQGRADELFSTRVYPVADLLPGGSLPAPHRLANPYLDSEEKSRLRIEAQLKKVTSAAFAQTPLRVALESISKSTGLPIRLDVISLQDEGIDTGQKVSLQLPNVPTDVVLKELLEPYGLTAIVRNETLTVMTQAMADETLVTRLYSTAGLEDLANTHPAQFGFAPVSFGLGGGGMAGMGGAMGGSAGGGGLGGGFGGLIGLGGALPGNQSAGGLGGTGLNPIGNDSAVPLEPFDTETPDITESSGDEPATTSELDDDVILQQLYGGLLQQSTGGKWMVIDQEGGAIQYFPRSQSMVVRLTHEVHREIADVLAQIRRQVPLPVPRHEPETVWNDGNSFDFMPLEQVLMQCIGAKWMVIDQEGGAMVPQEPTKSLIVRQTALAHEDSHMLLTQLRRACYTAELVPHRQTLDGIDDASPLERRALTNLPRVAPPRSISTPDEMKLLTARRPARTLHQRWKRTVTSTARQQEFAIHRVDPRLEIRLSNRTYRADGPRAAVSYAGLTLTEIDNWGDAARQLMDGFLPWLPHRSNEELAELFDISLVSQDTKSVTLRFGFPRIDDSYLQATFSTLTQQPIRWLAVAGDQVQFELEIEPRSAIARDPEGRELERWELIADEIPRPIPVLNEGWTDNLVVDVNDPDSMSARVRQAFMHADYRDARQKLNDALQQQPGQPLLNLMLAWCEEFADQPDPANIRAALQQVIASKADDLIGVISSTNFPSLGQSGLYEVLRSVPVERRSREAWTKLAEYERSDSKFAEALLSVDQALKSAAEPADRIRLQILRVDLLLRTGKQLEATAAVNQFDEATPTQLMQVADLFATAKIHEVAENLLEQVRRRSRLTGIALAQLVGDHANWLPKGKRRWEKLLEAHSIYPNDDIFSMSYLRVVLNEAASQEDAVILGELAATQKNESVRTRLRMAQADLLEDRQAAATIVLELHKAGGIPVEQWSWSLRILSDANRHADVIAIVENRLRNGHPIKLIDQRFLWDAYSRVGRTADAIRANDPRFYRR